MGSFRHLILWLKRRTTKECNEIIVGILINPLPIPAICRRIGITPEGSSATPKAAFSAAVRMCSHSGTSSCFCDQVIRQAGHLFLCSRSGSIPSGSSYARPQSMHLSFCRIRRGTLRGAGRRGCFTGGRVQIILSHLPLYATVRKKICILTPAGGRPPPGSCIGRSYPGNVCRSMLQGVSSISPPSIRSVHQVRYVISISCHQTTAPAPSPKA